MFVQHMTVKVLFTFTYFITVRLEVFVPAHTDTHLTVNHQISIFPNAHRLHRATGSVVATNDLKERKHEKPMQVSKHTIILISTIMQI